MGLFLATKGLCEMVRSLCLLAAFLTASLWCHESWAQTAVAETAAAAAAAPATAAAPAAHLAGTIDTGSVAWMLVSAALVFFMMPGLALFYGGMVRA
jgi:hypothetical protein